MDTLLFMRDGYVVAWYVLSWPQTPQAPGWGRSLLGDGKGRVRKR